MLKQFFEYGKIEAGCDEAGRGCLAGPVFAAAVILPSDYKNEILNDSKQLTEKQRDMLRIDIEKNALSFAVASINNEEIDKINILNASIKAMQLAVENLSIIPELLLIDGNRFKKYKNIPHKCIIKGDATYLSIAAASVLAKTHRDEFIMKMHNEFPYYYWNKNKTYPTKNHRDAIIQYGICKYHRKSYKLIKEPIKTFWDL